MPIADEGFVEGGFVTFHGVIAAKKVAAGTYFFHGIQTHFGEVHLDRFQHAAHVLQRFAVDDKLFKGGDQATFQPAGRVVYEVAVPKYGAPQRHLRFVGCLRVHGVGSITGAGAVRQVVAARQLAASDLRQSILGRTESGRT